MSENTTCQPQPPRQDRCLHRVFRPSTSLLILLVLVLKRGSRATSLGTQDRMLGSSQGGVTGLTAESCRIPDACKPHSASQKSPQHMWALRDSQDEQVLGSSCVVWLSEQPVNLGWRLRLLPSQETRTPLGMVAHICHPSTQGGSDRPAWSIK